MRSPYSRYCDHCGLPVHSEAPGPLFCCVGCRIASSIAGGASDGGRGFLEARLLLSAFLAMGVMTFSLVAYGEAVYEADKDVGSRLVRSVVGLLLAVFSLPVLLLLGFPLLSGAWQDLKRLAIRMDGLIVLATFAAFGLSLAHVLGGSGEIYFETATMVLVLVTFGRRLEAHAKTTGKDAAVDLANQLPSEVIRMLPTGESQSVGLDHVVAGDEVVVKPGGTIPCDSEVLSGESTVYAPHLTGESAPVIVRPGDAVEAGSDNGPGLLRLRVVHAAKAGSLGRILKQLESPLPETRILRKVDQLASVLAVVAIVLAVAGGLRSYFAMGAGAGLRTALSVLLVACPCALGLATPLAYRAIRAALAKRGLLVEDPRALEVIPDVSGVFLDKTGTLTDTTKTQWDSVLGNEADHLEFQSLVAWSGHALGRGEQVKLAHPPAELRTIPGCGVVSEGSGQSLAAGGIPWLKTLGVHLSADHRAVLEAESASTQNSSLSGLARDGELVAVARMRHPLRPAAASMITKLQDQGLEPQVVSGDREGAVRELSQLLGIGASAMRRPEAKVSLLEERRADGHKTLFVGDGVNDAPALRHGDVSMVLGSGTPAAHGQAQCVLVRDDLRLIPELVEAGRDLRRVVRGNLFWTLLYNGVAMGAAAMGWLHPILAVAAMIISSLIVAARSYQLLDWEPREMVHCDSAAVGPPVQGRDSGVGASPLRAAESASYS